MRRVVLALALSMLPAVASAHPLSPSNLRVVEHRSGDVEMTFRTPSARLLGTSIAPAIPEGCRARGAVRATPGETTSEALVHLTCEGGLVGKTFVIRGLRDAPTDVLWQVTLRDGTFARGLMHGSEDRFVVPARTRAIDVVVEYLSLGVMHLVTGLDHVLFVLALLFVLERRRAIVLAITAFTVGHSVSLALSALHVVRLPQPPVEVAIAATLLYMALEILRRDAHARDEAHDRKTAIVAGLFGLVHGLGFAGVLAETGLPEKAIPEALLGFNVGIELAQLGLVLSALLLAAGVKRLVKRPIPARVPAAYVVGSLAAMWIIERSLALAS